MNDSVHSDNDTQEENEKNKEDGKSEHQQDEQQPDSDQKYDQLIAISKTPTCKNRPNCLESCYTNSRGLWDPHSWSNAKIPSSAALNSSVPKNLTIIKSKIDIIKSIGGMDNDKDAQFKRKNDPKERIRDESQDDIVLSPQRRSFGTGCHIVPNKSEPVTRQNRAENHSHHLERTRDEHILHRSEGLNRGRVGSGRIVERSSRNDWSKPTRDLHDDDIDTRRSNQRGFSRNYDFDRRPSINNRSRFQANNSDNRRHSKNYEEEEEPEWFSAGPTSQNDFIELRGFDEDDRTEENEPRESRTEDNLHTNMTSKSTSPAEQDALRNKEKDEFDINEMFNIESWRNLDAEDPIVDPIISDGTFSGEGQGGTSRFVQWFSESNKEVESPIDRLLQNASYVSTINSNPGFASVGSRRFPTQDDHNRASTVSNSQNGPVPTFLQRQRSVDDNFNSGRENDLISLLQKANIGVNQLMQAQQSLPSIKFEKARSLAEIEAGFDKANLPNDVSKFPDNSGHKTENVNDFLSMLEERMKSNGMIKQHHATSNRLPVNTTSNGPATISRIQNQAFLNDLQSKAPNVVSKEEELFAVNQHLRSSARNGPHDGSVPFFVAQPPRPEAPFNRPILNTTNPPQIIPKPITSAFLRELQSKVSRGILKEADLYAVNQQIRASLNQGLIDPASVHFYPQNPQQQNPPRMIERQSCQVNPGHWLQEMLVNRARTQQPHPQPPHPMQLNSIPMQFNSRLPPPPSAPSASIYEILAKEQNWPAKRDQDNRMSTNYSKTVTGNVSAFIPTSVMRKFASDKDKDAIRKSMKKL